MKLTDLQEAKYAQPEYVQQVIDNIEQILNSRNYSPGIWSVDHPERAAKQLTTAFGEPIQFGEPHRPGESHTWRIQYEGLQFYVWLNDKRIRVGVLGQTI